MYPYRAALIFWGRDKCRVSHSVNCHNMSVKTAPVCLRPSVAEQWESSLTSNQRSFNTVLLNTAQTASSQQCRPFTARTSFSPQMIYCCPSVARNYKSHERILYGYMRDTSVAQIVTRSTKWWWCFVVGIQWQGNKTHQNDRKPLFPPRTPECTFGSTLSQCSPSFPPSSILAYFDYDTAVPATE